MKTDLCDEVYNKIRKQIKVRKEEIRVNWMHFLSIAERHYLVPQNVSQSTKTLFPEKYEEEMIQRTKETPVKKY